MRQCHVGSARVTTAVPAALAAVTLACWSALSFAADGEAGISARVSVLMSTLIDGSDAAFEALRDPCIRVNGRRICPGIDGDPGAHPGSDTDPSAVGAGGHGQAVAAGRAERGVTFVPGVKSDDTAFTALEDLLHLALQEGRLAEAADKASQLAHLANTVADDMAPPTALTSIGQALLATRQAAQAEAYFRRALKIELTRTLRALAGRSDTSPADQLSMALAPILAGLAGVAETQSRPDHACKLFERALTLSGDPDNADVLKGFALFEWHQGRLPQARDLLSRSLKLTRRFFGDTSSAADSENKLGHLALEQGQIEDAYRSFRKAASTAASIAANSLVKESDSDYLKRRRQLFDDAVSASFRLPDVKPESRGELTASAFEAAQWAEQTAAAVAVSRMTARLAAHDPELSKLARDFDAILTERQELQKALLAALAAQNADAVAATRRRIQETESRAQATRVGMADRFPSYAALAFPQPVSLADAQALLGPDEALAQFLLTDSEGFAWLLTRENVRAIKLSVNRKVVADQVGELRCGLDVGEWRWRQRRWQAKRERCRPLEEERNERGELPFRPDVAYALYTELLGPFEKLIAGKSLTVVPSGPLSALSLNVLVTAPPGSPPDRPDYRSLKWLPLKYSVTVVPSAASFAALRRAKRLVMSPLSRNFLLIRRTST